MDTPGPLEQTLLSLVRLPSEAIRGRYSSSTDLVASQEPALAPNESSQSDTWSAQAWASLFASSKS